MKTMLKLQVKIWLIAAVIATVIISCKKTDGPKLPTITFKTGGNYTSGDASVSTSDIINVGIVADKNKDDLKTFKIYSSTGSGSLSIKKTFYLTPDNKSHYEKNYEIIPHSINTYETWKFEITDAGGNVNAVSFKLTVN